MKAPAAKPGGRRTVAANSTAAASTGGTGGGITAWSYWDFQGNDIRGL